MFTLYYTAGLPTSTFFVYFVRDIMKKYVSTCVLNKIAYHGIAVQPRVYGPHPQKLELPEVEKLKQRSVITERKQLPTYIAGVRCGRNHYIPLTQTTAGSSTKPLLTSHKARTLYG